MITVRRHIELGSGADVIFAFLVQPARFPELYERVARWDRLSGADMQPGTRYAVLMHAGAVLVRSVIEIESVEPSRRITFRSISGIRQEGRMELRTNAYCTDLSISVSLALGTLLVGRLAERYVARMLAPRIDAALLALRCATELGQAKA